jgi:hypothetical protein
MNIFDPSTRHQGDVHVRQDDLSAGVTKLTTYPPTRLQVSGENRSMFTRCVPLGWDETSIEAVP